MIDRALLLDTLEQIRTKKCCAYGDSTMCDCKYRMDKDTPVYPQMFPPEDNNGCPELRTAMAIIRSMTDKELQRVCKRASIGMNLGP